MSADANPSGATGWDADTIAPTESEAERIGRQPMSPGARALARLQLIHPCRSCGRATTETWCATCAKC